MRALAALCLLAGPALADATRPPDDAAKVAAALAPPSSFIQPEPYEAMSAGAATVLAPDPRQSFSLPSANITDEMRFTLGNGLFTKLWIAAPASTKGSDGLGPLYNARACQDCHVLDGRGPAPDAAGTLPPTFMLRLGKPDTEGIAAHLAALPDPVYGSQLQPFAAPGQRAEGKPAVRYARLPVTLADGTTVTLRRPVYSVTSLSQGPLAEGTQLAPRVAPPMIGLGLLEAIAEADILAREDPDDANTDGISGRANRIGDRIGRFGLKAASPTVRDQSAQAFAIDLGLSTPLRPDPWGDCTAAQADCRAGTHGQEPGIRDGLEVDAEALDLVTFYARNLGVPARRNVDDPQVLRGKALFHTLNCTGCHTPKHVTARLPGTPEQSFQLIWPYTDLLLHDMGPGLADGLPEGTATGAEWRTPPLWGLGLAQTVLPEAGFLHDGRARTPLEAVFWHGGEAQASRDAVVALTADDRAALIAFLDSL